MLKRSSFVIIISVSFFMAAVFTAAPAAFAADEQPAEKMTAENPAEKSVEKTDGKDGDKPAEKQDDKKLEALLDEFIKYDEKTCNNASYAIDSKTKKNGKEEAVKMRAYFRDIKNFVMNIEAGENKVKVIVTPKESWMYMKEYNVIMDVPADSKEQFDVEKQQKKRRGEAGEITKSKDGDSDVYTIISKDKKKRSVVTCDPKLLVYTKVVEYGEKGELLTEAAFSDYKFGKIDDAEFVKPAGAEVMQMPEKGGKSPEAAETGIKDGKKAVEKGK